MKKVFLCDAAFSVIPLLGALKKRGFHVSVCGSRETDPCHALADQSFIFDYSNQPALAKLVQDNGFNYIVPGCTDVSYLTAAAVAGTSGLPGFDIKETAKLFYNKAYFRQYARRHGYPVPHAVTTIEQAADLTFPILIKPVDAYSGKGISKLMGPDELKNATAEALQHSPSKQILFEEFKTGKLFSHSAFIRNGEILIDFFVNEYCTVYPYQVNSSNVETTLSATVKDTLRAWLRAFASDAQLCDGLIHTQFITNGSDAWLIEVARRCPGDLYSRLIQSATGIDYPDLYIAGFCGLSQEPVGMFPSLKPISRHTVSALADCIYLAAKIDIPQAVIEYVAIKKSGEFMRAAPYERAGIYFVEHDSIDSMEKNTEELNKKVTITTFDY